MGLPGVPMLLRGHQIIAIDPGKSGGIARAQNHGNGNVYQATKMPPTPEETFEVLKALTKGRPTICYVENVGFYRPGNSAPAAVKFGKHVGHLEMALIALSLDTVKIVPSKWMRSVMDVVSKEKGTRKNDIKEYMQKVYPDIKVTLALSDALGILTYALQVGLDDNPIYFNA